MTASNKNQKWFTTQLFFFFTNNFSFPGTLERLGTETILHLKNKNVYFTLNGVLKK